MKIFDLFKKKDDDVPDVGKEPSAELPIESGSSFDNPAEPEESEETEEEEEPRKKVKGKKGKKERDEEYTEAPAKSNFEAERINARIESLNELLKGHSERFSTLSQQIGEVRAMTLSNEKLISKSMQSAEMAVDIVKEVKPEKLRIEYQKIDARISAFEEKVELNKQFMDTIMSELKELRRKSDLFIGTDAILKLNEDIKKDLLDAHKISTMARVHADKSEQIFIELKRGFADTQKTNEIVSRLDASYSGISKQMEKLKLDYSNITQNGDFEDYKKIINGRFAAMESAILDAEKIKENDERLSRIIETVVAMSKKNKEDIDDLALTIGDEHIQKVSDYETQLASVLNIIDSLAGQISEVKLKLGMKKEKIFISPYKDAVIEAGKKISLQNVEIHRDVSDGLKLGTKGDLLKKAKNLVKKAREMGYSSKEITKLFKDKGWDNSDISELL